MSFSENYSNCIINLGDHAFSNCLSSIKSRVFYCLRKINYEIHIFLDQKNFHIDIKKNPNALFNYIVFEFISLLVVQPWYSENYIATISYTWEWLWASRCPPLKLKKIKTNRLYKSFLARFNHFQRDLS